MDEWCEDNGFDADDWREWGDEEDVFFAYDDGDGEEEGTTYYTISYGVMSADKQVDIACRDFDEAEKIAYSIYKGEVGRVSRVGVLIVSCNGRETILIDRM